MEGFDRLPRMLGVLREGIERGIHPGAQLYVSRGEEKIADVALGDARVGAAMTTGTLLLWLSSGKPITAVAIGQLWEKELLELDDPVVRFIPDFAAQGKETITIRHLLTHTAGLRGVLGRWENQGWDDIIKTISATRPEPNWIPGQKAGYHATSTWYILAEIVQRLDPRRRAFTQYVREEIFIPLGMNNSWIGAMPGDRYRGYGERIGLMYDISKGDAVANQRADTEEGAAIVRPGASGRGPIRELGFFYEMLLKRGRAGAGRSDLKSRVLMPQTVEAMTARHRVGLYDQTFKHTVDWGLGFIINSRMYGDDVPYNYGPYASVRTFGHSGAQSSCGYCDPERQLVVAWATNGMPGDARHHARANAINAAIYEDLGLTS